MNRPAAPSRLLPAPAPPHDSYSVMLAGHVGATPAIGWRVQRLRRVDIDRATRALVLAPAPAAARWLSEPSGSFGGLRPPSNVAVTSRGDVLLLDPATGEIRRFDPCECRFVSVPCVARLVEPRSGCEEPPLAARVAAPRDRLLDPQGIAACGGDLFIADRGHHRVVRYAMGTWVPGGVLRLPSAQRLTMGGAEWQPTGLALDGAGRLVVSDPHNGRLDRFTARGRWIDSVAVDLGASHVAVDCHDRVYVVIAQAYTQPVPASAATVTLELDAGTDGFHWHTLQLSPLGVDARFRVDVHVGDAAWTAAWRNDHANNHEWTRWLDADAVRRALTPLPLGGRAGRFLRLRFTPAAGHVPGPFTVTAHGARVRRVVGASTEVVHGARADLVGGFGLPSIVVDQEGRLHLPCDDGIQVFDRRGERFTGDRGGGGERFEREGAYLSAAIDSRIDACQWHRVELRGAIPPGCSIAVRTATSEIELTAAEVESLPPTSWRSGEIARAMERRDKRFAAACGWDVLIASEPGRYLWVELVLRGDGRQAPCVSAAIVEYPRITLRRYLPGVFGVDPAGADFTDRFTAIFDRTLRSIETHLDHLSLYFDPLSAPAEAGPGRKDFLSWLGEWIGITLAREWPEARRRRYLKEVGRLYCKRGTPDGLRQQLLLLLGFDLAYGECLTERPRRRCVPPPRNCRPCPPCEPAAPPPLVLEHFKLRRWLYAGHGRLGSDSTLWGKRIVGRSELSGDTPSPTGSAQIGGTSMNTVPDPLRDPFHVFAHKFSVFVPSRIRENAVERRALEQLVAREAPAHTQVDIRYVEPRFRVGVQASIGLDGVIARTPRGVMLDESRLRQGSVLTGRRYGPHLEVGNTRIGTTTRLT